MGFGAVVERLVRGVVREAVVLGAEVVFPALGFVTVSSGVASGVGSGVGTAATSAGVGSGSGKRAPAEETRLPFRLALATAVSVVDASSSPVSGPVMAANDPPKNKVVSPFIIVRTTSFYSQNQIFPLTQIDSFGYRIGTFGIESDLQ
jgi:hypothetical protein